MKKKLLIIGLIILGLLIAFFFYKKVNKKENNPKPVSLTDKFDINLLKLVNNTNNDNYLVSPYSIKMALSLLKEGSNNNTLKEIDKVLNEKVSIINNENIKIANALFIRDKYQKFIEKDFINNLKNKYKSEVLVDEFKTPKIINNWVNKNTDGMIKKILDEMDDSFVLGLANAIAIDVKWDNEFECVNTKKEKFTTIDNKKIDVSMMHNTYTYENVSYIKSDNAKGIILPYERDTKLEFIGILPNEDMSTYIDKYFEKDLEALDKITEKASNKLHINLSIPKFDFSYSLDNFKDILINMGIKDAFDAEKADLTKMITRENLDKEHLGNLYVDDAIHKTYIDFNEVGTKAAAVTYFGVKNTSAMMPDDYKEVNIIFNKPFIAMIREKESNEILFMGVINKPNTWAGASCK